MPPANANRERGGFSSIISPGSRPPSTRGAGRTGLVGLRRESVASGSMLSGWWWPRALLLFSIASACVLAVAVSDSAGQDLRIPPERAAQREQRRFEHILAKVQPLLDRYGYGAAAGAAVLEGIGIPVPGQTLLMASAMEAVQGRMNIVVLIIAVAAAASAGNSIGYAVGLWGGRALLSKLRVNAERQQHLDDLFRRRGGAVIVVARFLDGLRQLNGIVAGVLEMHWWSFTVYNIAGALLWTATWGLGTYILGRDIHTFASLFLRHRHLLFALGVIALGGLIVYLRRSRREYR
ncbi:MAG: DedA family protein [Candidatus Binatia bacterium]